MQQEDGSLKFLEGSSIEGVGFLTNDDGEVNPNSPRQGEGNDFFSLIMLFVIFN